MASISGNGSKGHHTYTMNIWEESGSGNSSSNTSRVWYNIYLSGQSSYKFSSMNTFRIWVYIDGVEYYFYHPFNKWNGGNEKVLGDNYVDITHNNDGTKNLSFSFEVTDASTASYTTGNASASGSMQLETIARYFSSTPTLTVLSKTETSITYTWRTSETCDNITWHGTGTTSTTGLPGTTGTVTFSGLTADTSYNHYGTFRRKDSQLTTNSSTTFSAKTDNYPYVTSLSPQIITLGETSVQTINISNPHNRETTIYVRKNNIQGALVGSTTTTGSSGVITIPTSDLYDSIPNSQSGTLYYYCVYDTHTTTGITGTYQISGNERPTFPTSSWSYTANLTQLTNDNQVVIDGYSTISVTINTPATSNYGQGVTIPSYYATWGNATPVTFTANQTANLVQGSGVSLVVLANDSRGLQSSLSSSTKDLSSKRIVYNKPVVNNLETHRLNGIDTIVILNANGTMFKGKFGDNGVQNAIYLAQYKVKTTDSPNWSQAYSIPAANCSFDSTTGQWTITNASIHADGQSGGFPSGTAYDVKLEFYDAQGLLGYGTATSTIEDGSLGIDRYKDSNGNYHTGHNGLADDDYCDKFHGDIDIEGDIYVNGEPFEGGGGDTLPYGAIVDYDGNNVPDGYEEVTGDAPICIGSQLLWSNEIAGNGVVGKTKLCCAYQYDLITGLSGATLPTGYHYEYRISAQVSNGGSGRNQLYLNNVLLCEGGTWSGTDFRTIMCSNYFKKTDIPLTATSYGPNGLTLYYAFTSANEYHIWGLTLHTYMVKD